MGRSEVLLLKNEVDPKAVCVLVGEEGEAVKVASALWALKSGKISNRFTIGHSYSTFSSEGM